MTNEKNYYYGCGLVRGASLLKINLTTMFFI